VRFRHGFGTDIRAYRVCYVGPCKGVYDALNSVFMTVLGP